MTQAVQALKNIEVLPAAAITPLMMLSRAVEAGASVEVIERLTALFERWEANMARKAFNAAIVAAKAKIPVVAKNRHVGFDSRKPGAARTDYWHEDLAEIERTVRPHLAANDLDYRFETESGHGKPVTVTCVLFHKDGHEVRNKLDGPPDATGNKNAHQAIASAVTLLQRYTLKAALGLAVGKDDAGKAAGEAEMPLITDEQRAALDKLFDETGADAEKFCAYFQIEFVSDLPAAKFADAVKALEKKRKQQ